MTGGLKVKGNIMLAVSRHADLLRRANCLLDQARFSSQDGQSQVVTSDGPVHDMSIMQSSLELWALLGLQKGLDIDLEY
jgi:hypothetical protein